MKKHTCRFGILFLSFFLMQSLAAANYNGQIQLGYNSGPGLYLSGTATQLAKGFPFDFRAGIGYTKIPDPGKALSARKIFINNATNGTPEKGGHLWDLRFDLLYPVHWLDLQQAWAYGGLRYAAFTANFNFINGNENFDINSQHWGWGGGMLASFPLGTKLDLLVDGGLDYFFASTFTGHDTSYSPDNENVNPREDFRFKDADEAINQPKFNLRLMMGIAYHF